MLPDFNVHKRENEHRFVFMTHHLLINILVVLIEYIKFSYTILSLFLQLSVSIMMTLEANSLVTSLQDMRNFIIIVAIFELFESIISNNFLYRFMVGYARLWSVAMNSTLRNYQSSLLYIIFII